MENVVKLVIVVIAVIYFSPGQTVIDIKKFILYCVCLHNVKLYGSIHYKLLPLVRITYNVIPYSQQ